MNISQSVTKKDNASKAGGEARYADDYPDEEVLHGRLIRSRTAHARILGVKLPPLPEGYLYVDKDDVPGVNRVHIVEDDTPVFAEETLNFIGDPVGMLVGPDERKVEELAGKVTIEIEELPPMLDMDASDTVFFDYGYKKGDVEAAFAQADRRYEETFRTGYQEQAYLEPQGLSAVPGKDRMTIHGSLQCPYYVHTALLKVLGYGPDRVRIVQDTTGGGFGGKEDYPSILAAQAAVAAHKAGRPVRVIFGRREDMEYTTKRHPSKTTYKAAVKDGRVTAMSIEVRYDSGAYTTLSPVVLQRGIICASGVYNIPNLSVHGQAKKTNTVPTGAFRGFGAPQTFFAVELLMDHIAADLGVDALAFKEAHLVRLSDATATGGVYHFPVPLPAMIEMVDKACDYRKKRAAYSKEQSGRIRRGIGMSLYYHGAGFTGSGERDLIKAVASLRKYPDGRVEILSANTDIGQGLMTTFTKIVAAELNLPGDAVLFSNPDTDRVPDSGPTVASRSLMIVGELLRRAAIRLKNEWEDGEEQTVTEHFTEPDFLIPFDLDTFHGDAYPTFSWGVVAVEVEVDTLTGVNRVTGASGAFDVGTPIDTNIVMGQMEGGFLQGIGYASMEQMHADTNGRIRNNSFTDYIIPTSADVPNLHCMLYVEKYPQGPYGAKGAGELPIVGAPGAFLEAMEQALGGAALHHIPFTMEDTIDVLKKEARRA